MGNVEEDFIGHPMVTRERWRKILNFLNQHQYQRVGVENFQKLGMPSQIACANIHYLNEHGLIEADLHKTSLGHLILSDCEITPKGIDYLSEDGGLSAELNVVSIKFDVSQLQMLIEAHINASNAPKTIKKKLQDALKELPAEGLKSIFSGLVQKGLQHSPEIIPWLETMLNC